MTKGIAVKSGDVQCVSPIEAKRGVFGGMIRRGGAGIILLGLMWLLPPYFQRVRHLCPVRPDGISQALALPAFARKYGMSCSQCHSDYPTLNSFGRQFKMNGYVVARGSDYGVLKSEDQELWTEANMPWAVIVRSRPFDSGHGMANNGAQMGGSANSGAPSYSNGPLFQPINDIDMFIAGGDAAKHVSYFGEMDANQAGGFAVGMGDLRAGYHPSLLYNIVLMRRGFWADDPYQTIVSNETPTIANRATDLVMNGQAYLSGMPMLTTTQTGEIYGQVHVSSGSSSFFYYSGGVSKDPGAVAVNTGQGPETEYLRFAYDSGNGFMLGTFGQYGQTGGNDGGSPGVTSVTGNQLVEASRVGLDALWEHNNFNARAAYVYAHDSDSSAGAVETDQAAYAEIFYTYKRDGHDYSFLVPLLRENWLTMYNGTEHFNYVTAQLAHYFAPNFKGFVEYTVDTGRGYNESLFTENMGGAAAAILPMGNRLTAQLEVGF